MSSRNHPPGLLIGHPDGGMEVHDLPLPVLLMEDGAPPRGDRAAVRKREGVAGHSPARRSLAERTDVGEGPDAAARPLHLGPEEFRGGVSWEPLVRIAADQESPLIAGHVPIDQRWVTPGGGVEPRDDELLQLG